MSHINDPITIDTIIALFPQLKRNFMEYVHTNVKTIAIPSPSPPPPTKKKKQIYSRFPTQRKRWGKHTLVQKCPRSS